jgi:hypothetical protein
LKSLFVSQIAVPLFAFNVGIEIGQIAVLVAAVALFWLVDRALSVVGKKQILRFAQDDTAFQLRLVGVSAVVTIIATGWAWARWPV